MRYDESNLFQALEVALKSASKPLGCNDLYAMPEVSKCATTVNRVSDYLGALWRKGRLMRLPAQRDGQSRERWLYQWKGDRGPALHAVDYEPRVLADRPTLLITEEGNVITVEMSNLIISIRQKPRAKGSSYLASLKSV